MKFTYSFVSTDRSSALLNSPMRKDVKRGWFKCRQTGKYSLRKITTNDGYIQS